MMKEPQAIYNDTVNLLKDLDDRQLYAVHAIIVELAAGNNSGKSPLGIDTEEQLWAHIDHSLEQARNGLGRDADDVIDDLRREFAV